MTCQVSNQISWLSCNKINILFLVPSDSWMTRWVCSVMSTGVAMVTSYTAGDSRCRGQRYWSASHSCVPYLRKRLVSLATQYPFLMDWLSLLALPPSLHYPVWSLSYCPHRTCLSPLPSVGPYLLCVQHSCQRWCSLYTLPLFPIPHSLSPSFPFPSQVAPIYVSPVVMVVTPNTSWTGFQTTGSAPQAVAVHVWRPAGGCSIVTYTSVYSIH